MNLVSSPDRDNTQIGTFIIVREEGRTSFHTYNVIISKQRPPFSIRKQQQLLKPLLTFPPTTKAFYYMIDFQKFRYLPTCVLLPTPCIEVL